MSVSLLNVFKNTDFEKVGETSSNLLSLSFHLNKRTGTKMARAVLDDGPTLIQNVTTSGVKIGKIIEIPKIFSREQRNKIIFDLYKEGKFIQEEIATMLNISQSTVSNVLRKK